MSGLSTRSQAPASPWTESVLADVCANVGLDPSGARLIKFTNNAVYALAHAPVVVRIPGSPTVRQRVGKIVAVARWLGDHDMPAVRLIEDLPQPLHVAGHDVTLWHRVPVEGPPPTGRDLGRILRRLHALPRPSFQLPPWQPLGPIRQRLAEQDVLTSADQEFLELKCDEMRELLTDLTYRLPPGPIHGDSFVGNLIPTREGPVICDFDSAAFGPREWDLAPVAVGKVRFSYTGEAHDQLVEIYGTNVLGWHGFGVLRQLRELQLVTSVLPVLRSNPTLIDQWRHRLRTFREGDTSATWTPYK